MIYNTLTDAELRRAVDNAPDCVPALQEAARRFLLGSKEAAARDAEIERLESELSAAEDREGEAWARVSELEDDGT